MKGGVTGPRPVAGLRPRAGTASSSPARRARQCSAIARQSAARVSSGPAASVQHYVLSNYLYYAVLIGT